ncbi:hypothetical protein ALI144C_42830 [Actinosynnema sp. ALI-1.44]|nr:hypothetical protein ALI144C_42830 [Actinosynnema sp. ALI-1.44]
MTAPPTAPTAHFIFGTNQVIPANIVADRYREGLAPLVITTGGANRHNGVVEGQELRRLLTEQGVSDADILCEDQSASTQQNVELALPHLRAAVDSGFAVTAVCKWYHLRAIHYLRQLLPEVDGIHAVTFEPVYSNVPITRENWSHHPDGRRRVLREWQEVSRRIADGSFDRLELAGGMWR